MSGADAARAMWEQRFGGEGYHYGTDPNGFLREHEPVLPQGSVLLLAEG
jgi:hypothetical protein